LSKLKLYTCPCFFIKFLGRFFIHYQGLSMNGRSWSLGVVPLLLMQISMPASAAPIDLSQLCSGGSGDCVISANTSIGSASGALNVGGNFTVNQGVVLEFRVPVQINVSGNMVLSGTIGAPGDGGAGGNGGAPGQPGGAGGNAPAVASGTINVLGSITLNASSAAATEGGSGGSGGAGGSGQLGGAGGAGGAAGSLTFNTCTAFTSATGAQVRLNGGAGGIGQTGASGGAGGAAGAFAINAKQNILSDAAVTALGGAGGSGGSGSGANGANGSITLNAGGTITVGSGTLNAGSNSASINQNQTSLAALSYCVAPTVASVSPNSGRISGGSVITITGTGFLGATGVTVGGAPCTNFTVVNSTTITCTAPTRSSAGPVSVEVTTPSGTSTANTLYVYQMETAIPTLSEWAVLLLTSMIVAFAAWRQRRR
jgi:hypothetical protein